MIKLTSILLSLFKFQLSVKPGTLLVFQTEFLCYAQPATAGVAQASMRDKAEVS